MTDEEVLKRIGLSPEKLRDLLYKFNDFLKNLDPEQRRAFLHSLKPTQVAAAELDEDVTPERLQAFLGQHAPPDGVVSTICLVIPESPLAPPKK